MQHDDAKPVQFRTNPKTFRLLCGLPQPGLQVERRPARPRAGDSVSDATARDDDWAGGGGVAVSESVSLPT